MKLNRVDKWTSEDINKILANIKENSEAKETAYLKMYSHLNDSDVYPTVQRDASFHARLYSESILFDDYNQSICVDVFRNNDTTAEVEILLKQDKEDDYILQHFDFISEDGKVYSNDSFDETYRSVWEAEINHNASLLFAINAVDYGYGHTFNLTNEYLKNAVSQYSSERIADDFLAEVSIDNVISCLNLNSDAALSVKPSDFQKLAKMCIARDEEIAKNCLLFLVSRCDKSYPLVPKQDEKTRD